MTTIDCFAFAGLWELWRSPAGENIASFTIITTEPNDVCSPFTTAWPAISKREDEEAWLDQAIVDPAKLLPMLRPYDAGPMHAYKVSPVVNNPRNDVPQCMMPW